METNTEHGMGICDVGREAVLIPSQQPMEISFADSALLFFSAVVGVVQRYSGQALRLLQQVFGLRCQCRGAPKKNKTESDVYLAEDKLG
jgi:hypothetical protein